MLNAQKFAELEYSSLRKEIETSKDNILKFVIGGSAVVPSAQYLAEKYSIGAITLALPVVVVVLVLLYLSENHAIMRAGSYIRNEIEPHIEGLRGWETWLASDDGYKGSRTSDKLAVISFSFVAAAYFVASIVLAARYAKEEFGDGGSMLVTLLYVIVGIAISAVLYFQARMGTTSTNKD